MAHPHRPGYSPPGPGYPPPGYPPPGYPAAGHPQQLPRRQPPQQPPPGYPPAAYPPPGFAPPVPQQHPVPHQVPRQWHPPAGPMPAPQLGDRPVSVTLAAILCWLLALGAFAGVVMSGLVIVEGLGSSDSDKRASGIIFGGLALVITGAVVLLYILAGVGLVSRGNPKIAQAAAGMTFLVVIGGFRRAIKSDDLVVPQALFWVAMLGAAITILILVAQQGAKPWLLAKNRAWLASKGLLRR